MAEFNNKNRIPIIMVVGAGRSGSTLMDLIFNSHSQIVGVGELAGFYHSYEGDAFCGCRKKLKECGYWEQIFKDIDAKALRRFCQSGIDFLLNRGNFYIKEGNFDVKKYIKLSEKLYENILTASGKKIVFDSSKSFVRAEVLLASDKLDITLLHLVRDGRGVVYSNVKRGRSPFYFTREWGIYNLKTEIIKMRNKQVKNVFVYYDDFAREPERVIKYVLGRFDLSFEPQMLNFRKKTNHLAGGNYPLIFLKKETEIKPDMEWKRKMSVKHQMLFNMLFGWLNVFYKFKPRKY